MGHKTNDPPSPFTVSREILTKGEVYYVVTRDDASPHAIIEALRDPASFLVVAAFSRFQLPRRQSQDREVVAESVIEQLAKETLEIYVSAYDQEGFLVWQRR